MMDGSIGRNEVPGVDDAPGVEARRPLACLPASRARPRPHAPHAPRGPVPWSAPSGGARCRRLAAAAPLQVSRVLAYLSREQQKVDREALAKKKLEAARKESVAMIEELSASGLLARTGSHPLAPRAVRRAGGRPAGPV